MEKILEKRGKGEGVGSTPLTSEIVKTRFSIDPKFNIGAYEANFIVRTYLSLKNYRGIVPRIRDVRSDSPCTKFDEKEVGKKKFGWQPPSGTYA